MIATGEIQTPKVRKGGSISIFLLTAPGKRVTMYQKYLLNAMTELCVYRSVAESRRLVRVGTEDKQCSLPPEQVSPNGKE